MGLEASTYEPSDRSSRGSVPELGELVSAARHHPLLVIILGCLSAATMATFAWTTIAPAFKATSYVQVRERSSFVLSQDTSAAEDAAFVRAQQARVLAKPVLDGALARINAATVLRQFPKHDAGDWVRERTTVKTEKGSEVMTISVKHPSAEVAFALNTALTKSYLKDHSDRNASARKRKQKELEEAARKADLNLDQHWQRLHEVAERVGTGSVQQLTVRDEIQLQSYRDYAQRLRAAQLRGSQLRSRLIEEQAANARQSKLSAKKLEQMVEAQPEVTAKRLQLEQLDQELRAMSALASRQDAPRVVRLRREREYHQEQLEALLEDLRPQLREKVRIDNEQGREERISELTNEIEVNADEVAFLSDKLVQLEAGIQRTGNDSGVQLEMIRHAIERQTRLADNLWHSLEQLKIEAQAPPRVALIETASLPQVPDRSKQIKAASFAGGSGLLLAVLGIGYLESRSCRIRDPKAIASHTRTRLFGTAGFFRDRSIIDRVRRPLRDPLQCGASEVVATLAGCKQGPTPPKCFLVTSATDSEPRHLVAAELTHALALDGLRTLVIDADVAAASFSRLCGAIDEPGLSQVGTGELEPRSLLIETADKNVVLLPIGRIPEAGTHAVSQQVESTLDALDQDFEAIVVVGPAVITTPESVLLAAKVDGALLSVVIGHSRWDLVAAAHDRLNLTGTPLLGCIPHVPRPAGRLDWLSSAPASATDDDEDISLESSLKSGVEDIRSELQRATSAGAARSGDEGSDVTQHNEAPHGEQPPRPRGEPFSQE